MFNRERVRGGRKKFSWKPITVLPCRKRGKESKIEIGEGKGQNTNRENEIYKEEKVKERQRDISDSCFEGGARRLVNLVPLLEDGLHFPAPLRKGMRTAEPPNLIEILQS
jgi:hypothetical protein